MMPTGNMLGVVGVKISMKSVPQNERLKITKVAYRKLQSGCGEPASDKEGIVEPEDDDIYSYLGNADANHYMKPCFVNIKDSMLDVLISEFSVLRMPLQSLAVVMLVSSKPCRLVCLGKTHLCSFQLGQDSERVALFIQLASIEKANQLLDAIEGYTAAASPSPTASPSQMDFSAKPIPPNRGLKTIQPSIEQTLPRQYPAPTVKPPQLPPRQAHIASEPLRTNQPPSHQLQMPPINTSRTIQTHNAENNEPVYVTPEQLPDPAFLASQQQRQKVKDTARSKQLPLIVLEEIKMKISQPQNEYIASPVNARFNRKMSEPNISFTPDQIPSIAPRRHSLKPVAAEFQRVSTPTSVVASSEPVSSFLGEEMVKLSIPEAVAIQGSQIHDNDSSLNNEQHPYMSIISKSSDSDTQSKEQELLFDTDGYLIMRGRNPPLKAKAKPLPPHQNIPIPPPPHQNIPIPPPPHQNIPKPPGDVLERLNSCEYESLPPPPPPTDTDTRKRQSKIITELYEDEKRYINELKELQSALAVPGISRDSLRVVQKLYEFHRLTFCPLLKKACIGSKRDLAKVFTENCSNFKIYEEMLLIRSKCMNSANMANFRDKLLIPLVQLQKYKIALSALQDRDHDDTDLVQEAKDVIHSTLLRADNYLLLDSIAGFPFTRDQCGSIVNKGTMKIKSKGLSSKKDYMVILTETHLVFAEKLLLNKNQYIGCLRMDNINYEGQIQASLTLRGILHPGNGKVAQFTLTAQNTEAAMIWARAIKERLAKRTLNPTGFHQRSTIV